jgi:hypothetical protein
VWAGAAAVLDEAKGRLFEEVHAELKNTEQPHLRERLADHGIRPSKVAARLFQGADAAGSGQEWARVVRAAAPGWLSSACVCVPFNYEGGRRPTELVICDGPDGEPLEGLWRDDTAALAHERLALIAGITGVRIDVGARVDEALAGLAPSQGAACNLPGAAPAAGAMLSCRSIAPPSPLLICRRPRQRHSCAMAMPHDALPNTNGHRIVPLWARAGGRGRGGGRGAAGRDERAGAKGGPRRRGRQRGGLRGEGRPGRAAAWSVAGRVM